MDPNEPLHDPMDHVERGIKELKECFNRDAVYMFEAVEECVNEIVVWQIVSQPNFNRIKEHSKQIRALKNNFQKKFELTVARWIWELQEEVGAEVIHPIEKIKNLFFNKQGITRQDFRNLVGMKFGQFLKKSEFVTFFEFVGESKIILKKIENEEDIFSNGD
uniref:Uncharacterized protein n=1 Tax=Strongyloides papillosus TaxID=174720 RepID=A0A0N5BBZ9_STREA